MGDVRDACRSSLGIPHGKREFGKPRSRREGTVKRDLTEIYCNGVDCIHVV
jgi:hypothetical protein